MTPIGQSMFSSREENFFGITGHFPSTDLLLLRLSWGSLWLSHTMLILILLFHKVKEILSDFHAQRGSSKDSQDKDVGGRATKKFNHLNFGLRYIQEGSLVGHSP